MQMLHPDGHAPHRPVEIPVIVGALGPKGNKVARAGRRTLHHVGAAGVREDYPGRPTSPGAPCLTTTRPTTPSTLAPRGPGWALSLHGALEFGGPDAVRALPGGDQWMEVVERAPDGERHLAVHDQHCVGLNEADQAAWAPAVTSRCAMSPSPGPARRCVDKLVEIGGEA